MNRLNIAITFDYELFLGENFFDSDTVLFEPTYKILNILKDMGCTATFFADVCSVYQHEKYGLHQYSQGFSSQLKKVLESGCDVQLHIHPNWLCSEYERGKWHFDYDSYRIHYFDNKKNSEYTMESIIGYGIQYLENLLRSCNDDYRCIAYRAGGYAIQPHEKLFSILKEHGIYIDSSVVVNDCLKGPVSGYNFSNAPKQLNWWTTKKSLMEDRTTMDEKLLWEVPVMTVKNNLMERVFLPKNRRVFEYGHAKGQPMQVRQGKAQQIWTKARHLLHYNHTYRKLCLDEMNYHYMSAKLNKICADYKNEKVYIALIGHPKAFTGEAFDNFSGLLEWLFGNQDKFNLVNMTDIYRDISNNLSEVE